MRTNYKAAVPQFYRRRIQLLLPLCLEEPGKVNLALCLKRDKAQSGDEFYVGKTVLRLNMAYKNARVLCRPDKDWLAPIIEDNQEIEEEEKEKSES